MEREETFSKALLACKCPRCRKGDMFLSEKKKSWFKIAMHKKCPNCEQTYEPEPGFYFGAMFVSYGFSATITLVTGFVLYNFFNDPPTWVYMTVVISLTGLFWPLMFRYSRAIFLHVFGGIRFDPNRVE